ncbi:MAG: transporter substrate-binding domain-containing protein, partial [SAR324 cluster bacterium]|nr:transporter substrate-binding domain-containing protein [SAR324 cluster bacterium]
LQAGQLVGAAWAQSGTEVVMGLADGDVILWNLKNNTTNRLHLKHEQVVSWAYDPQNRRIASGRKNGSVDIFDQDSTQLLRKLTESFEAEESDRRVLKFSADGKRLMAGSEASLASVWDVETGKNFRVFKGIQSPISAVGFHPMGRLVVTGSKAGTIKVWDTFPTSFSMSQSLLRGGTIALKKSDNDQFILTASWNGEVMLFDRSRKQVLFQKKERPVADVALSHDGTLLVVAQQNGKIELYGGSDYSEIRTIRSDQGTISKIALHPNHQEIAVGAVSGLVSILDATNGKLKTSVTGHHGMINSIAYSSDGKWLLIGGQGNLEQRLNLTEATSVHVWNTENASEVSHLDYAADVNAAVWSPDEKSILTVSSEDKTARLWDAHTGRELSVMQGHMGSVLYTAFTPDGTRIVTGSIDKQLKLWDTVTGREIMNVPVSQGISGALAFNADGLELLVGDSDGNLRVYHALDWKKTQETLNTEQLVHWRELFPSYLIKSQPLSQSLVPPSHQPHPKLHEDKPILSTAETPTFSNTLSVRADFWPPFNGDPKASRPGYMIEVLKAIFEPLEYGVDYQLLSWDSALKSVNNGESDLAVGTEPDESPDFLFPDEPIGMTLNSFFIRKDQKWRYQGIDSLRKIRLGIVQDYSYVDAIDAYIQDPKNADKLLVSKGKYPMKFLLPKLLNGDIDAVIETPQVIQWNIKEQNIPPNQIVPAGNPGQYDNIYAGFSPHKNKINTSRQYAKLFDQGIRKLRESGKLQTILDQYGIQDWHKLQEESVQILTREDPPVNYSENGRITGAATEMVREILQRVGQPDNIQVLPWKDAYQQALTKDKIALYSTTRTEQREHLFKWVGPLVRKRDVFYAKKGSGIKINTLDDAKKISKIATITDFSTEQFLKANGFNNLLSTSSPETSFQALMSDEARLWPIPTVIAKSVVPATGFSMEDLEEIFEIKNRDLYIAFSIQTPDAIVNKWQQALDEIKREGIYGKIYEEWLPGEPVPGETQVIYPFNASNDTRSVYHLELLKTAMELTHEEFGPYRMRPSKTISSTDQKQQLSAIAQGNNDLNIMLKATSVEMEARLIPVRIPLDRGILGYRFLLIRQQEQKMFSKIQVLAQLQRFSGGQRSSWADATVLEHNQFKVVTVDHDTNLFQMLDEGKFDFISRGITEAWWEQEQHKIQWPNLQVEDSILLHYPYARYFWFSPNEHGKALARRVEKGLETMIQNGAFNRIFFKYYKESLQQANLVQRDIFEMENPFLPSTVPLARKELWFDPVQFIKNGGLEGSEGSQTPLTLMASEYPPWNYVKDGKPAGFAVDVVHELMHREHRTDSIQISYWNDGYQKTLKDPNTAVLSTMRTLEMDPLFKWVGPLAGVSLDFIGLKKSRLSFSLESAKRVGKIAVVTNSPGEQLLKQKGFTNLQNFTDERYALKALAEGVVNLWVVNTLTSEHLIQQAELKPEKFEKVFELTSGNLFIAFSKDTSDEIVNRWQTRLDEMKQDGTFKTIHDQWLPPETWPAPRTLPVVSQTGTSAEVALTETARAPPLTSKALVPSTDLSPQKTTLFHWDHFLPHGIPGLLTVLICLFLASLTIQAGATHRENQLFTIYCLLQALSYSVGIFETIMVTRDIPLLASQIVAPVYVFILPVSLHFIHRVLGIQTRKWLERSLYALSLIYVPITMTPYYIVGKIQGEYGWVNQFGPAQQVFVGIALIVTLYGLGILIQGIRQAPTREKRQKLLFIMGGLALSAIFSLIDSIVIPLGIQFSVGSFGFLPLILMAYGLLQHQLLDTSQSWFKESSIPPIMTGIAWLPAGMVVLFALTASEHVFDLTRYQQYLTTFGFFPTFSAMICLTLASFCFVKGKCDLTTLLFGIYCVLYGWDSLTRSLCYGVLDDAVILQLKRTNVFFFVNCVGVMLHFYYRILHNPQRKLVSFYYVLGMVFIPITLTDYFYHPSVYRWAFDAGAEAAWGFKLFSGLTALVIPWCIFLGIKTWKTTSDPSDKKRIFYTSSGLLCSGFLVLSGLIPGAGSVFYPPAFFTFIPLLFMAYGIFRHDLITINVYTKKRLAGNIVKGIVIAGYLALIPVIYWAVGSFSMEHIIDRIVPFGIPPLLSFAMCLFLIFLSVRVGRNEKSAHLFILLTLIYSFWTMDILLNGIVTDVAVGETISRWDHLFFVFASPLLLHLSYSITRKDNQWWIVYGVYAFSLVLVPLTQTPYYFQGMYSYYWGFFAKSGPGMDAMSLLFVFSLLYSFILLKQSLNTASDAHQKHQFQYLLYGFISSGVLGLCSFPAVLGYEIYPLGNFVFITFSLFAYGMFQSHLNEALQIVRKILFSGFIQLAFVGLAWSLKLVYPSEMSVGLYWVGINFVLFAYRVFYRIGNSILALFFKHQSKLLQQAFEELSQRLSQIKSLEDIKDLLKPLLFEDLSIARFSMLWFSRGQQRFFGWTSQNTRHSFFKNGHPSRYEGDQSMEVELTHPLLPVFQQSRDAVPLDVLEEWILSHGIDVSKKDLFRQSELIQPVYFEQELTCLLLFGKKVGGSVYSPAETELVRQLGLSLGPYIENAQLMQGLEARVKERTREIDRIQKVIQTVNSTLDLDTVMAIVITELMEIFEFRQVLIHELIRPDHHDAGSTLKFLKAYGSINKNLGKFRSLEIPVESAGSLFSDVVHKKEFLHLSKIYPQWLETMDSRDQAFYEICPFKSILIYPLEVQGKIIGTITFANTHHAFQVIDQDLQRINNYLTHVATAINNARMSEETKAMHARLNLIHHISQIVSEHLELEKATSVFIEEAVKAIYPEGSGSILMYLPESNNLQLYASYGLNFDSVQAFQIEDSPETMYTYSCFKDKVSKVFESEELRPFQNEESLKLHFGRPAIQQLVVPLVSRNESFGLITISHYHPSHHFSKSDQSLLENITLNIAHHFENAQSYKAIQAKEQEIAHINQVVLAVNSTLDLDEVLKSVMEALQGVFEFDQTGIMLIDQESQELFFTHVNGPGIDSEILRQFMMIRIPLDHDDSFYIKTVVYNDPNYIPSITPELVEFFDVYDRKLYQVTPVRGALLY